MWAEEIGIAYPKEEIYNMWETVLLNQFHDILPGTSIKEVYEVTKSEYAEIESQIKNLTDERIKALAGHVHGDLVLFNTLSFVRDDIAVVDMDIDAPSLVDEKGNIVPLQRTHDDKLMPRGRYSSEGIQTYDISSQKADGENVFSILRCMKPHAIRLQ